MSVRGGSLGRMKEASRGQIVKCPLVCAEALGFYLKPLGRILWQMIAVLLLHSLSSHCFWISQQLQVSATGNLQDDKGAGLKG